MAHAATAATAPGAQLPKVFTSCRHCAGPNYGDEGSIGVAADADNRTGRRQTAGTSCKGAIMTTQHVRAAAGDTYDHLGLRLRMRLTGRETAGGLALIEHVGRRGAGSPLHRHTREAETFIVLDGELDGWSDEDRTVVAAGDTLYLPAGSEHAYRVRSATARFLLLITPAGFEQFFITDGVPSDPDADLPSVPGPPPPEAVERLAQILTDYGVSITGPPPNP
jgi:quercetin dioxygenase-like cupin family protein